MDDRFEIGETRRFIAMKHRRGVSLVVDSIGEPTQQVNHQPNTPSRLH